jgi:hypothetical protein
MNTTLGFCAIVLAGWVSPELAEPERPLALNLSTQPALPQPTPKQPQWTMNRNAMRPLTMPLPPTDPRAFLRNDLPLPPTANCAGTLPGGENLGPAQRHDPAGPPASAGRSSAGQKPFENVKPTPTTSPYLLLYSSTNNGTISPYAAYVRPAQQQEQLNQSAPNYGP